MFDLIVELDPESEKRFSVFDDLLRKFSDGAAAKREELAKKLIDSGQSPEDVSIGERIFYDEKTHIMKYECFPIND